jgi:4-hydroxybenzoate polyprenyltransferase
MTVRVTPRAPEPPLCVDLDGTLLRSDSLHESVLLLLRTRPLRALLLPVWLLRGRAALKRNIAEHVAVDATTLPYHAGLLDHLRGERARGRRLVLVSAADHTIVRAVADHLNLFDEVIASDGERNLKGPVKRDVLAARYGEGGYDYAGNEAVDLAVWSGARRAVVVGAGRRVVRRLGDKVSEVFPRAPRVRTVLQTLRVQQWVKNLLVFMPLLMAPEATNVSLFVDAALAFLAFSLCASSVYVVNDLLDLDSDRRHARKRHRPFASGELPLSLGLTLAPACLLAGLTLALLLPSPFLRVLLAYMAASTIYSYWLKYVPLVDVMVLAMLYAGRVIAGGAATYVQPSPWLLGFSLFFFLSLAFVKRYAELYALRQDRSSLKVRGYYPGDLELITLNGTASGYMSVLVAALYINGDRASGIYRHPELLWLVCPFLLYWVSRIWMLAHRGEVNDDPLLFAIKDPTSYVVGACIAAVLILARM